jgi:site-specific DNA recombinase
MNAAIYARKSTKQHVAEEQRSVERQIENARAFAATKGWTVRDEYTYVDDGISGAEFAKRPGLNQLLRVALSGRPPFRVLIVSEQKSIGREMSETGYVIKQLAQAGVEIFEYVHGQSLTPKTPTHKLLSSVQSYADEDHRVKTTERNREKATQQVKHGHVAGGRVFGYKNKHVLGTDAHGNPKKLYTVREIDEAQAAVVRHIYELYDSGFGIKAIAKRLNQEQATSPIPFKRKDGTAVFRGWSPETVKGILGREMYKGVVVWNKEQKRDSWGKVNWQRRPSSEWLRMPVDENLRIVPEALWNHVAARRADTAGRALRFADGRMSGRPPKHETKNLLAGLAQCGLCGGAMVVETSPRKHGRVPEYVCKQHRWGRCANGQHVTV